MSSMPPKGENVQADCWKCGAALICRTVMYQANGGQTSTLQWQSASNGKPHYKCTGIVDGAKVFVCVPPTLPPALQPNGGSPPQPAAAAPSTPPHRTSTIDPHPHQVEYLRYALDLEQVVVAELRARGDPDPNPARVGMLIKLVLDSEAATQRA